MGIAQEVLLKHNDREGNYLKITNGALSHHSLQST